MAKSSNKEPLSPLFLSPRALQEDGALPPKLAKRVAAQPTTPPTYRAIRTKDGSAPTLGVTTQAHAKVFWSTHD
jgi:hypothetical protein